MNEKREKLVRDLLAMLPEGQREVYAQILAHLIGLGYEPARQKVAGYVLSFKHRESEKVIAKAGFRQGRAFLSVRFFACKSAPQKYIDALRQEIDARGGQYCGPLRSQEVKNRCGFCASCSGGGLGYYYRYPEDGREVLRCGAYPILIPEVGEGDVEDVKAILSEQHRYFASIS